MGKKEVSIPTLNYPIIETHFHLDYLKEGSPKDILEEASKVGIEKFITISVSPDNFDTVIQLCNDHNEVFGTQGVHPHQASCWDSNVKSQIIKNLSHEKIVAVGEIGLDYYYNKSPREIQLQAFEEQIEIAIDNDFPLVVHSRDAEDDTILFLNKYAKSLNKKGVIHSFTSNLTLAQNAIENGFYLGFNGIITFKNASNVQEALKLCPLDRIIIETDSPFLSPVPVRGKENSPKNLPFIAEKIAELKEIPVQTVLEAAYLNSKNLFSRIS